MYTIFHLIPTLEGGGAERQLILLAREQAKRRRGVHIGIRRGEDYKRELRDDGIEVHILGDHAGASLTLLTRIHRIVRTLKPNVVQTWLPQMDVSGGVVALWTSSPWLISERSSRLAFEGKEWWSWVRPLIGRRANAIVANSGGGASYWKAIGVRKALVEVIPNAIDVDAVCNASPTSAAIWQGSEAFFLVVGRLGPEKCVDVVVDAVRLVQAQCDVRLLIVGEGPLRNELEVKIRKGGVDGRICIIPYQRDWWGLLKTTKAMISMSRFEGQPNVVLEAMAAECPLIVSDIPAHRELLDEDSALFVKPSDSASLATTMRAFLADTASARRRARVASVRTEGRTVQRMTDAYERVYERIIYGSAK